MRFRFCGGLEPPDWLLAEIPLLATLDAARVSEICEKLTQDQDGTEQPFQDLFETPQDAKAVTAALRFVLFQAAKYDVFDRELAIELLQLGMTGETAEAIAAVYESERVKLRKQLETRSFKYPTIEQLKWRVHTAHDGPDRLSKAPQVEMRLQLDRAALSCDRTLERTSDRQYPLGESLAFTMSEDKFLALYEELTQAQAILQSLAR